MNNSIFDLSKQDFIAALNNNIVHDTDISLLNCFIAESNNTQSAPQLAEKLGYSDIGPVNALVGKFAKRIADYYDITLERDGNSPGWWRIIADGQDVNGTFFWTLKPALISALSELHLLEKTPTYWILPCNEENYDVEKAYIEYHTIDWSQKISGISINDIIYIYETKPKQRVRFTCRVIAVNKKISNNKDRDCYRDSTPYENAKSYMTLEFINRFEIFFPVMNELHENGIPVVRGLSKLPEKALNYIKEKEASDYSTKRYDGTLPSDIPSDHWSLIGGDEEELKEKEEKEAKGLSDSELFERAKQQGSKKTREKASTTSTYIRNTYVAEASKRRANGICQLCNNPAPFKDKSGNPYLESHHIIWLSEGGSDTLDNTAALCPNCHRKMHIVNDENDVKKLLELNKL